MSKENSDNIDLDVPIFKSLGMKIDNLKNESDNDLDNKSNLENIDITKLYQKEPFESSQYYSKTSFFLIFLVFIIFCIVIIYYYFL